jgi:hypothetical protein
MRIAAEPGEEPRHLLVHHRVARHPVVEIFLLRLGRQVAVKQQVADLQKIAVLRQLIDRITAMQQYALVAVDIGDSGFATRGRGEPRIIGEHAGVLVQRTDVDDVRPDGSRTDFEFCFLVVENERCRPTRHGATLSILDISRKARAPLMEVASAL